MSETSDNAQSEIDVPVTVAPPAPPHRERKTRRSNQIASESRSLDQSMSENRSNPDPKPVRKARVLGENAKIDPWFVKNKDPNMHYSIGNKDSQDEMNIYLQRNYAPARGNEEMVGNPFQGEPDQNTGKTKERGNRILMCCPKDEYEARRVERMERFKSPQAAADEDRATVRAATGGKVDIVSTGEFEKIETITQGE